MWYTSIMPRRLWPLLLLLSTLAFAKDALPPMDWPATNPVLRFSIGKLQHVGNYGSQQTWNVEVSVTNISPKKISQASFLLYLFDKKQIRIGQGYIDITNVAAQETIRLTLTATTTGSPETFSVAPQRLPPELAGAVPPKPIGMTVYSVPSGAKLSVDKSEIGITPIAVQLVPGSHTLAFVKEGYNSGSFPLVVTPDQLPGASVTFELGSAAHDTVELRDGTVVNGDVQYIDATSVVVTVGGEGQKFPRNQVKRILLIEREEAKQ
jgi:hypothetical protein